MQGLSLVAGGEGVLLFTALRRLLVAVACAERGLWSPRSSRGALALVALKEETEQALS